MSSDRVSQNPDTELLIVNWKSYTWTHNVNDMRKISYLLKSLYECMFFNERKQFIFQNIISRLGLEYKKNLHMLGKDVVAIISKPPVSVQFS